MRLGSERDVDRARVADGLAHVEGLEQRQLGRMLLDQRREPLQRLLALLRREARPDAGLEGGAGAGDGGLDVRRVAGRDLPENAPVDRADAVEGLAAGGVS